MLALHSNWTKPRINTCGGVFIEDFDIMTTILSALKWREKNGTIKMVTDNAGYKFYEERGMMCLWDAVTTELEEIPDCVNPQQFWAAGKLFALRNEEIPVAVIDTDFIVWDRLAFDNLRDIMVIHREDLYSDVYPEIHHFNMKRGYIFNPDLDWRLNPANTAFYVIKSEELRDLYVKEAVDFMYNAEDGDTLTYMVFAEQRLLPMCANMIGVELGEFSNAEKLFCDGERYFTHTWGMKQQMREDSALRYDFCMRCARRIKEDFAEYLPIIEKIPEIKDYFA